MSALLEERRTELVRRILQERGRRAEAKPELLTKFQTDPLGFTMWDFRWGLPGILERFEGPDGWQKEFLRDLGEEVKKRNFNGHDAVTPIKMSVSAGKGVGKGVLAALVCNWIIKTWPYSKGTVTANTFPQLETKTWATIQHWLKMSRSSADFIVTGSGVRHKVHGKAWSCAPQTCSEENLEAFAGQHASNSIGFFILDESSSIPDKTWETALSGMVDGMPIFIALANPTRSSGRFFRINFGDEKSRWNTRVIDARECMIPNKETLAEEIEYQGGEDSDYVRVYIRGLPPQASDMQFIESASVWAAQKRSFEVLSNEPLIAGVDLARGGGDKAVIRFRRGDDARTIPSIKIEPEFTRNSMLLVSKLVDLASKTYGDQKVAVWFLDGGGIGGPIIDRMVQLGHTNFIEIQFGGQSPDPKHFVNIRSYMWSKMRDALRNRLAIDKDRDLEIDLTGVGLGRPDKTDRLVLESKEDMKKRGMASPDNGDALALTYAQPVALVATPEPPRRERAAPYGNPGNNWMAG